MERIAELELVLIVVVIVLRSIERIAARKDVRQGTGKFRWSLAVAAEVESTTHVA